MRQIMNLIKKYEEIISYLFWGGMTTVVSWGTYSIFSIVFRMQNIELSIFGIKMSMVILIANILSWICAFSFAFVTNKVWVFKSKNWKVKVWIPEFGKFFSARAFTGVLEIILVPMLVGMGLNQTILGIEGMVAKVCVSVLVVLLNYIFSKLFIFKKEKS